MRAHSPSQAVGERKWALYARIPCVRQYNGFAAVYHRGAGEDIARGPTWGV